MHQRQQQDVTISSMIIIQFSPVDVVTYYPHLHLKCVVNSGVFMGRGHSVIPPSRRTPYYYEKSTGTVHGRLVRGHLVAGTLT